MTESQKSRAGVHLKLTQGALRCLGLVMLSALALIAAPLATAAASAAPSTARGGDPLALLAIQQAELTVADAATNKLRS